MEVKFCPGSFRCMQAQLDNLRATHSATLSLMEGVKVGLEEVQL